MGCHAINNDVSTLENPAQGKVYCFEERQGNYQGNYTKKMYPCQRKSDGVCGMYDVISQKFFPMAGTTITDAAAGPILDEYWDLTAPE